MLLKNAKFFLGGWWWLVSYSMSLNTCREIQVSITTNRIQENSSPETLPPLYNQTLALLLTSYNTNLFFLLIELFILEMCKTEITLYLTF